MYTVRKNNIPIFSDDDLDDSLDYLFFFKKEDNENVYTLTTESKHRGRILLYQMGSPCMKRHELADIQIPRT